VLKKITLDKLPELAAALMEKGTLVAPVKEDAGFNFREISNAGQVDLNFHNTIISPKSAFFPQMEDFVRYQTGRALWIPTGRKEEKPPPFSVMLLIWTCLLKRKNFTLRWVLARLIPKAAISS
jgi:hypothetical protein